MEIYAALMLPGSWSTSGTATTRMSFRFFSVKGRERERSEPCSATTVLVRDDVEDRHPGEGPHGGTVVLARRQLFSTTMRTPLPPLPPPPGNFCRPL